MTGRAAPRVVSLVPSATETLIAWGLEPVGCTRFCEQPGIPQVGGTKNPDLEAIAGLRPDLVVVNDEENRREDAIALSAAGLSVHACSPRSVTEVVPALAALASAVGVHPPATLRGGPAPAAEPLGVRAFVPIWRRPWMTMAGDTYGSSLLEAIGVANVCARGSERYPTVDLADVRSLGPDLVLAPSEPYAFRPAHLLELAAVAPVVEIDGQDLFWWGVRTPAAIVRIGRAIAAGP